MVNLALYPSHLKRLTLNPSPGGEGLKELKHFPLALGRGGSEGVRQKEEAAEGCF
jgi:hypothetical protein